MNTKTAWNHAKRLENKVRDIYCWARSSHYTHEKILQRMTSDVWSDPALKKCPGWVHDRLTIVMSDLSARLYKPDLHGNELDKMLSDARAGLEVKPVAYVVWAHRLDGAEITSDQFCERRKAGDENVWERVESAHVWNDTRTPFSPWENMNKAPTAPKQEAS